MVDYTAQKIYKARKCPRCGCKLFPPYAPAQEDGDKKCGHCGLKIKWEAVMTAISDEEDGKHEREDHG